MRTSKRFGSIVLALAAVFAVAAQPAAAGKKPRPKPKPDFAVKSVTILGATPYYIVLDRTDNGLVFNVKVKNQGKAASDGDGTLTVRGDGILRPTKFKFEVPKLKAGETETLQLEIKGSQLDGITTYATEACASANKDSKPGNDCRAGPGFAAIPRTWTGSVNGTWTDGQIIQSLVANPVTFTFAPGFTETSRAFIYLASGTLTATITGDHIPDCSFSGTGDTAIDPERGSMAFELDLQTYRAAGRIGSTTTYPAQIACDNGESGSYGQEFGDWIETDNVARDAADDTLTGSFSPGFGDSYSWNLRAE
jgi:hypothetical protein